MLGGNAMDVNVVRWLRIKAGQRVNPQFLQGSTGV